MSIFDALEDLRVRCAHCDAVFAPRALEYGADARRFASETLRDAFDALERDEETNGFLLRGRERGDAAHRGLARARGEARNEALNYSASRSRARDVGSSSRRPQHEHGVVQDVRVAEVIALGYVRHPGEPDELESRGSA